MASSNSQQAVSEQPTLLSPMGSALAVVDVNHVQARRGSQNEGNGQPNKKAAGRGVHGRPYACYADTICTTKLLIYSGNY